MCGISGVYRWDGKPVDPGQLKRMSDCIAHRGPDDEGFYASPAGPATVGLGFRRLAIIDLSGGHQPMTSASGRLRIVFNGEIYNYRELRMELEKRGCKFNTRSDTEVILNAYEVFGKDCVRRLRGMFAFAIWDEREKSLFLARDRAGKKPLFYARKGQALYFASEMKALLKSGEIARDVNLHAIPLYLAYQFIPSPATILSGVERLPPAHWLFCDAKGNLKTERYWTLPRAPHFEDDIPKLCEELREKLEEATRIRLVSDVPLGAFLSGGIDSSAVVGYMAKNSSSPVKTFSIGFEEQDFSELEHARKVAKHFGTDHHEFVVKPDAAEVLPKLAWHYDQPFADPSALPSYYVARETRKHVTVALNGDGGDESFGGYLRYQADLIFQSLFSHLPKPLRGSMAKWTLSVPSSWQDKHLVRRIMKAGGLLASTPEEFNYRLFAYFDQSSMLEVLSGPALNYCREKDPYSYFADLYGRSDSPEFLDRVFACDTEGYLPDCLLVKMDIASMANSLEARSPFLDHELMEFAARIPPKLKVKWNGGKWILKEALKDFLPPEILNRRKMGFGIPLNKWFRGPLNGFLKDHLLSGPIRHRGIFQMRALEKLIEEHETGKRDHGYKLWALLMFELWAQVYLDNKGIPESKSKGDGNS